MRAQNCIYHRYFLFKRNSYKMIYRPMRNFAVDLWKYTEL